jgi:hypothetical protein
LPLPVLLIQTKEPSFRPKLLTPFVSSAAEKSASPPELSPRQVALALAVACSFSYLHLPLLVLFPHPKPKNRHLDWSLTLFVIGAAEKSASPPALPQNNSFPCLYHRYNLFFRVFRPKIACQVPKQANSIKQKEIELAR